MTVPAPTGCGHDLSTGSGGKDPLDRVARKQAGTAGRPRVHRQGIAGLIQRQEVLSVMQLGAPEKGQMLYVPAPNNTSTSGAGGEDERERNPSPPCPFCPLIFLPISSKKLGKDWG